MLGEVAKAQRDAVKADIARAWHTAAFVRRKGKLPPLKTFLRPEPKKISMEQARADHAALLAAAESN
ncbi:MAG TPA: hypothetical protein VGR26_15050 [Acidimicrobiales bacterium]|nr:hypothetical protein [Acidimicrobiales bacterium]